MRKKVTKLFGVCIICLSTILFMPSEKLFASDDLAEMEDGAYSLEYVILHAETESVSIANDYFEKPATLFIEDGEHYVQFTLNHSQWTKELQAPLGNDFVDVDVISENDEEDTRIVEFKLDQDLSAALEFKMHVLIESMEPVYDHRYTVRFDFDLDSLKSLENVERKTNEEAMENTTEKQADQSELASDTAENNDSDQSSNSMMIWIVAGIIGFVLVGGFIYYIRRKTKNKNRIGE